MGNWIGGDRDGNPNVDADDPRHRACRRHSEIALRHYLTEVHQLGAELSISLTLAPCSPALQALAERSGDDSSHRADEPYRRALTGIYSRLAGTLRALTDTEALRHAIVPGEPYRKAGDFLADLMTIRQSLEANHGGAMVRSRLGAADPGRAGVRLPSRHHRSAPELRQARGRPGGAAGGGAHRGRLCGPAGRCEAEAPARAASGPPLPAGARLRLQRGNGARARRLREGPQAAGGLRPRDHPPLHHQPHRERERSPGGARPAEGKRADAGQLWRAARAPAPSSTSSSCRCSRPSRTCARPKRSCAPSTTLRASRPCCATRAACRTSCSATPTATRTAATSPPTGSSTGPRPCSPACSRTSPA